jgi:hypothetical protein
MSFIYNSVIVISVIFIILFIAVDVYISYKMVSFASAFKPQTTGEPATTGELIKLFANSMITTPYYAIRFSVYGDVDEENIMPILFALDY